MVICSPSGRCSVTGPSVPGASRFLSRTFANVPRTIASWLPRRAPYELKSSGATPRLTRYWPDGLVLRIEPVALRHGQPPPALVAVEDLRVALAEHRGLNRLADHLGDFLGGRPDVAQK